MTPYVWWNQINGTGETSVMQFGMRNVHQPVPADYEGDGKTDLALVGGYNNGSNPPTPIRWFIRYTSGIPDLESALGIRRN